MLRCAIECSILGPNENLAPFPPHFHSLTPSRNQIFAVGVIIQSSSLKIALWLIIIIINVIHRWQTGSRRNQVEHLQCTSGLEEREFRVILQLWITTCANRPGLMKVLQPESGLIKEELETIALKQGKSCLSLSVKKIILNYAGNN